MSAVADASVIVTALLAPRSAAADALREHDGLLVPAVLTRIEVLDALRRQVVHERMSSAQAEQAERQLAALTLRERTELSYGRIWELRSNLRLYDAAYVALAERLDVPLLTRDARLAKAPGPRCAFQLVR